ncbi:uncharacterized protein A4U43_C07F26990 [Asparagus officinalis]|uniref:Uncharacterized protein n=1 Tax=Asparagus officinalis TaxID=4686 RepID=A0A5P1EFA5_ASPOF|nr:uncharacterized protein A4U43_C07F26990 [Asparagus officinalis]
MPLLTTKIPRCPLLHLISIAFGGTIAVESRDQKLNQSADDLLALTKAESEDYSTLFTSRRTETRARASPVAVISFLPTLGAR